MGLLPKGGERPFHPLKEREGFNTLSCSVGGKAWVTFSRHVGVNQILCYGPLEAGFDPAETVKPQCGSAWTLRFSEGFKILPP